MFRDKGVVYPKLPQSSKQSKEIVPEPTADMKVIRDIWLVKLERKALDDRKSRCDSGADLYHGRCEFPVAMVNTEEAIDAKYETGQGI
jgi:hypothetical protein